MISCPRSHNILTPWPEPIVIEEVHLIEGAREGAEKVLNSCYSISTCHICPSNEQFPPTPCFVYRVHAKCSVLVTIPFLCKQKSILS
jgi:hypothetical protein